MQEDKGSVRASKQLPIAIRNRGKHNAVIEENTEIQFPSELETEEQQIDRMLTPPSSVISPTIYSCHSTGIFSRQYVDIPHDVCGDMLESYPISKR